MPKAKASPPPSEKRVTRKALTPEAREAQLVNLAIDLAEDQLRNGTASSQVITHYLKLGTEKAKLEREILAEQRDLYAAKTQAIKDSADMKELYANALIAMQQYSGTANATRTEEDGDY